MRGNLAEHSAPVLRMPGPALGRASVGSGATYFPTSITGKGRPILGHMPPPKKSTPKPPPADDYTVGTEALVMAPQALLQLPAEIVGIALEQPVYEPNAAEELFQAYLPRLKAIGADRLQFPRLDVSAVSRTLLGVYAFTQIPHVFAIYEAQAAGGQFVLANLDRLRKVTLVLIHAFRKVEAAGALKTAAKVSPELDTESLEVEKRMQKVCEDFFPDDPLVLSLRPGTGYIDRGYDLFGYADVYEQNASAVAGHVQYRATDKDTARSLAGRLLAAVDQSMNEAQKLAFDQLRRTWTLLLAVYFEVQRVGLCGLRYDPAAQDRFPSVYAVGRKGGGRKKAAPEQAPNVPAEPPPAPAAPAEAKPANK